MRRVLPVLASLLLCFSISPLALADSLVVNGGFETGDFTGWAFSGDPNYYGVAHSTAHSGSWGAWFGSVGGLTFMSQTITTVPGASYDFGGWLEMVDTQSAQDQWQNEFHLWWNNTELVSLINSDPFEYTQGYFPGLIAEGTTTVVAMGFWNPPGYWAFDDMSVTPAVPEPASLILLGTGLAGIAAVAWHRRR